MRSYFRLGAVEGVLQHRTRASLEDNCTLGLASTSHSLTKRSPKPRLWCASAERNCIPTSRPSGMLIGIQVLSKRALHNSRMRRNADSKQASYSWWPRKHYCFLPFGGAGARSSTVTYQGHQKRTGLRTRPRTVQLHSTR